MAKPLRLVSLKQTCLMFPSQWEGRFEDGGFFYARWRGGYFYAGYGPDEHAAVCPEDGTGRFLLEADDNAVEHISDEMTTEEMLGLLGGIVRYFPPSVDPEASWRG